MTSNSTSHRELSAFLRSRRGKVRRKDVGLPPVRGREFGLSREEVAVLCSVSITWYTWLEQGREVQPSREVVESIAEGLHLGAMDTLLLFELCGYKPGFPVQVYDEVPETIRQLVEAMPAFPCFTLTPCWDIVDWNAAYAALFPPIEDRRPERPNLLTLFFTDPYVRRILPDWEVQGRTLVAEFRAELGKQRSDPAVLEVVRRLAGNEGFDTVWGCSTIEQFASQDRYFTHPEAGELHLRKQMVCPADHPDLHIVMYTPATPESASRLARMTYPTAA